MRADELTPNPDQRTRFAWSHHVTVPEKPGCYALTTYSGDVLYVGLATGSVRSRMGYHLDTEAKRKGSDLAVHSGLTILSLIQRRLRQSSAVG